MVGKNIFSLLDIFFFNNPYFSLSKVDNNSYYLALVEPTSSHPLQATDDQERHYGKVDMDTKYADVNDDNVKSGDIANTLATIKYDSENVNSVSVDKKDITKLGDIVAKFTSSHPQVQEYFSPQGAQPKQPAYTYGKHLF